MEPELSQTEGSKDHRCSKVILLDDLAAARDELLASAGLVPTGERASRPVCGDWTLVDVLGHITDWEWVGVEGLRCMAEGQPPQVEPIADIEAWNQAHAEARRGQPWQAVWDDLHAARTAFLECLKSMSETDLDRTFPFPWGSAGTVYDWVRVYIRHDREHAQDLKTWGAED